MSRSLPRLNKTSTQPPGAQLPPIPHHITCGKVNSKPKKEKHARHTHKEDHQVAAPVAQRLGPTPWWRRHRPTRPSLHTDNSSAASTTSVGPHLFSAFFVTPRELAQTVRRWAISFRRKQRKRQEQMRRQSRSYPHPLGENKRDMTTTFPGPGTESLGHPQHEKESAAHDGNEMALALTTARLLWASVQRSTAACVDVRSSGRMLAKRCRCLVAYICPMLPYTATHKRAHLCTTN